MGVVDFSVLGALQKVRSFVAGAAPAEAADGRPPATPRSRSGDPSPENSPPPAATRSGGRRAIALRRQISSPQLLHCRAVRRADDEDDDEPGVQFFTPGNDFIHDFSDIDSVSVSTPNEINRSLTPSPLESPTWTVKQNDSSPISRKNGCYSPDSPGYGTKASLGSDGSLQQMNGSLTDSGGEGSKTQYPVDFSANIWSPPPPEDEGDDIESRLFGFDDDDDEVGDSSRLLVSGSFSANKIAGIDEVTNIAQKEGLKTAVLSHFRALVAQLLKAEGIDMGNDDGSKNWLDIVSSLTWQAASYVRPDTKKGGSMDPTDYVKVKCIASGDPRDSNFVQGVVCSKNVKHKRMVSEHRNAKLLILGGALEYHKVPNKLASINRILEQEKERMKMIVGKIESRQPNVVLVEKSVSSSAQELFSKDISLVLNVKRTLLDRISRCTGAQIASVDSIASARLGQCEVFKVQKVTEFPSAKQTDRRSSKTLMFFEGCPWRLGCTVLLRGSCREELKRIKRAVQLAVFAAYHLSLETSFFADEGATLPKFPLRHVVVEPGIRNCTNNNSAASATVGMPHGRTSEQDKLSQTAMVNMMFEYTSVSPSSLPLNEEGHGFVGACEHKETEYSVDHKNPCEHCVSCATGSCNGHETSLCSLDHDSRMQNQNLQNSAKLTSNAHQDEPPAKKCQQVDHWNKKSHDDHSADQHDLNEFSGEYFPGTDNHQSILVSLSSTCIPKGLVCERSHLFRIKFYGSFDKPLGRYLREDLFDQAYCCQSCKEPSESHIRCYTHQHGSLTISVHRLRSRKLPGERDGRIWMWHRCLKCKPKDGIPPATRRIIMSDAAWGLSFGKFLELSFSNHATANRVASCGHSLQRDCLRFYGYGNMVAFFRYSPVDILSVNLPPSVLDFNSHSPQEWLKRVAVEIFGKMEALHVEVSEFLHRTEKNIVTEDEPVKECVQRQIIEMKDLLKMERNEYEILLLPVMRESNHPIQTSIDILELNRLRRGLLLDAYIWDRRLCHVDSVLKTHGHASKTNPDNLDVLLYTRLKEWKADLLSGDTEIGKSLGSPRKSLLSREGHLNDNEYSVADTNLEICLEGHHVDDAEDLDKVYNKFNGEKKWPIAESTDGLEPVERLPSLASIFSDKIDLAWTGSCDLHYDLPQAFTKIDDNVSFNLDSPNYNNIVTPVRIHSFNSTLGLRQRERTGLAPASLHLPSFKSAEYFGPFGGMTSILKDPMPNVRRACSQRSPGVIEKLNVVLARTPTYISSASNMINDGARLLLPQIGYEDVVVAVYDDEPTSIISYALTSEEYVQQVAHRLNSSLSFSHLPNTTEVISHGLEVSSPSQQDHLHSKGTHFKFSFDDDSPISPDKTKFSVICYFEKHFAALRKKCCPKDIDYIRSLSRCKRWNAQGGKSNVYFAKTMDERFIIKQVTRTELESFVEFAPQYFKYLMESLTSSSPTCLAKIVGLYQVSVKSMKAGKEVRMDLMVMENIFFERKISRVYDLKGSLRSRYTAGDSKVLLDSNLIEALHTKPIFLGSKAKRRLERAVWNDTSFLALADVMDYSLLVGIDEEKKELVIGIIDYLRQYTWDKQLETWVKASGILGGPKNESPTVISPMQYKKRFRKAMSKYFLTVPDQWSS